MRVLVNGRETTLKRAGNIRDLLDELGLKREGVAVELNKKIVKGEQYDTARLRDGDSVEIVHLVGGGQNRRLRRFKKEITQINAEPQSQ